MVFTMILFGYLLFLLFFKLRSDDSRFTFMVLTVDRYFFCHDIVFLVLIKILLFPLNGTYSGF